MKEQKKNKLKWIKLTRLTHKSHMMTNYWTGNQCNRLDLNSIFQ